jgi:glycosyltransferase involved in cell wall biosynthesis
MTSIEHSRPTSLSGPAASPGHAPTVAVVVASKGSRAALSECLASLVPHCLGAGAELVVPRADTPSAVAELSLAYPYVRFLFAPPRTTVRELRQAGLAAVGAAVVDFVDDGGCRTIPGVRWLERTRRWSAEREEAAPAFLSPSASPGADGDAPAAMAGPRLSVVVAAHQCADALGHSLEALARSSLPRASWELIVVDDASTDGTAHVAAQFADTLVRLVGTPRGPAYARNRGFEVSRGECVAFIGADVCVHRDTLSRLVAELHDRPAVSAVFGSYDTHRAASGFVTQYRNLLLHYYHRQSAGAAHTFWASCGAVRSEAFAAAGMFDEWHFPRRQVEDFELGQQLCRRGHCIVSCPEIQATHLKRWTLAGLVAAEFQDRTVPWMRLFHRSGDGARARRSGRRRTRHVNAALVWLALLCGVAALVAGRAEWLLAAAGCVGLVLLNDRGLHHFLARERGAAFAIRVVPLHLLTHLVSGAAIATGWALRALLGEPTPNPTVEAYAELGAKMWPPVPSNRARAAPGRGQPA